MSTLTLIILGIFFIIISFCLIRKRYKTVLYIFEWMIPSSTAVFIYLNNYLSVEMLPAYLIASMAGAIIYYPVNKYIFKKEGL